MFHLCAACNLSKSDSMPSNYEPEQLWFQHYSYDIEGESITISENATALEVATANSIYDVVFDDDVMLTVKRGQRTVNCAYTSDVSGIHDINGRGRCLVIGVEPSGEAADAAWSFRTSPVQNERTTPAAVAMTTLGVTPGRPVTFAN